MYFSPNLVKNTNYFVGSEASFVGFLAQDPSLLWNTVSDVKMSMRKLVKLIPEDLVVQGGQDLPKEIKRTLLYEQSTTRNGQHLPTRRLKITEHNSIIEFPRCLKAVKDYAKFSEDIPKYNRKIRNIANVIWTIYPVYLNGYWPENCSSTTKNSLSPAHGREPQHLSGLTGKFVSRKSFANFQYPCSSLLPLSQVPMIFPHMCYIPVAVFSTHPASLWFSYKTRIPVLFRYIPHIVVIFPKISHTTAIFLPPPCSRYIFRILLSPPPRYRVS